MVKELACAEMWSSVSESRRSSERRNGNHSSVLAIIPWTEGLVGYSQ